MSAAPSTSKIAVSSSASTVPRLLAPTIHVKLFSASAFDIWSLGIVIVIGGQYFCWNVGLTAGVLSNALALFFMGTAYVCLILSMAEMTATLPFAGGAYGLSRCCVGYFCGFVIGCCEALEYIAYVSSSVLTLGQMLQVIFPVISTDHLPLVWLAIYVLAIVVHVIGGRFFWNFTRVLAVLSTLIVVIYLLGSLPAVSYAEYGGGVDNLVVGGFGEFFTNMPLAAWFFVGIESLNTLCSTVENPKEVIPRGQIPCVLTLFVSGFAVFFVAVSLPPGAILLSNVLAVFNPGFIQMFGMTADIAMILSIPATFATIFGFILAYANILSALANSRLLPLWIGAIHPKFHTQTNALIIGSVMGYILCFCVTYSPTLGKELFNICMFFGFSCYMAQCAGYLYLKREFGHLPRSFTSPVGKPGVYYAAIVWILNWISIVGCQENAAFLLSVVSSIVTVLIVYYLGYAKHRQTFSDDERKILFFAHVSKSNQRKRKKKARQKTLPRWALAVLRVLEWFWHIWSLRTHSRSVSTTGNSVNTTIHPWRQRWASFRFLQLLQPNRVVHLTPRSQVSSYGPPANMPTTNIPGFRPAKPAASTRLSAPKENNLLVEEYN
ncbi:hypothetical protein SDRG_15984 [Saprolegnia diclina VS20]|uniref:Amino acid permease/ SLC12A domain-containing protein n=1 Tax=Saprolegnia diclina (strain VS20) TaxID=1156394 RepID=T0PYM7_SAPDV|nr:hypothetical protein SDRG_15984 [Saprolegnia diclina VS20]EQC26180.1 hypothetical protein SDRG_15984 [Saprolegnia diclina VS20]|eukprot:XP_008620395.1 hypothetical protein SDRG_15984 [Saprolegnia diclina VS20]